MQGATNRLARKCKYIQIKKAYKETLLNDNICQSSNIGVSCLFKTDVSAYKLVNEKKKLIFCIFPL